MIRAFLCKRVWHVLLAGLVTLILLSGIGIVTIASTKDHETYTAPGRSILVNGHTMHPYCIGEGSPTVLLESGVGGNTLLWT